MTGTHREGYTIYEGEALKQLQRHSAEQRSNQPRSSLPPLGTAVLKAPGMILGLTSTVVGGITGILR